MLDGETWAVVDKLLEAQCVGAWDLNLRDLDVDGFLQYCENYLKEISQVLTVNIGEKFPLASCRWKGTITKYARTLCSLQNLLSGETSYQVPNLLGYCQSLTDLGGEGNTPLQSTAATLAVLFHLRGGKATENAGKIYCPETYAQ